MIKNIRTSNTTLPRAMRGQSWLPFISGLAIGLFVAWFFYLQGKLPLATDNNTTTATTTHQPEATETTTSAPAKPKFEFYTILPENEVKVPDWQEDPPPANPVAKPKKEKENVTKPAPQTHPTAPIADAPPPPKPLAHPAKPAVPAPNPATTAASATTAAPAVSTTAGLGSIYYLQIGSFQRQEEADKARAKLALMGVTTDIQKVVVNGKDTWFRVRVGPIKDSNKLNSTRTRLAENNVNSILLKLRP